MTKKQLKLTVNTGKVMFIGRNLSLHSVNLFDKSLVKYIVCLCIIYWVTKAIAVMYSRNIPMAENRNVCL